MNVRPSGALRSLVVRPASRDDGLIHVRLRDDSVVPDVDEVRYCLDRIAATNGTETTVRSSALFPRAAERFEAAGFEVADRLALLRAVLDSPQVRAATRLAARNAGSTRTMRRHHFAAASAVDNAAFGAGWGHDSDELAEICRATPASTARYRTAEPGRIAFRHRGAVVAFAIAGASSDHGYLQRLAVDPGVQRRGHGRALTIDSLRWMMRRRLPDCLVNTSVDNEAALGLYDAIGFRRMDELLSVLWFDLRSLR
jgi:ribosomal protein S18 acetylase RimI-like enzyme